MKLAHWGNDVILRQPPRNSKRGEDTSDLLINGIPYDIYTPKKNTSVDNIVSGVVKKSSQAVGVVIDTSGSGKLPLSEAAMLKAIQKSGGKIKDVIILNSGSTR